MTETSAQVARDAVGELWAWTSGQGGEFPDDAHNRAMAAIKELEVAEDERDNFRASWKGVDAALRANRGQPTCVGHKALVQENDALRKELAEAEAKVARIRAEDYPAQMHDLLTDLREAESERDEAQARLDRAEHVRDSARRTSETLHETLSVSEAAASEVASLRARVRELLEERDDSRNRALKRNERIVELEAALRGKG